MHLEYTVILSFDDNFRYPIKEPHITLADYNHLDLDEFIKKFNDFFNDVKKLKLHFDSIGSFPKTNAVFLAPTLTSELWDLHHNYHQQFKDFNDKDSYYQVDRWVPHCTIDNNIENINTWINKFSPFDAVIDKVKLIEVFFEADDVIDFKEINVQYFN